MDNHHVKNIESYLARIDQHLEAIALCLCRREKISIPVFRDEDCCNFYNHLPDQQEPEENPFVFSDEIRIEPS